MPLIDVATISNFDDPTFDHAGGVPSIAFVEAFATGPGAMAVTYGGEAMTKLDQTTLNVDDEHAIFVLENPPAGTQAIVLSGYSGNVRVGCITFTGSEGGAVDEVESSYSDGDDTLTVANTNDTDMIVEFVAYGGNGSVGASGQTENWDQSNLNHGIACYHKVASAGTTDVRVTHSAEPAHHIAYRISEGGDDLLWI